MKNRRKIVICAIIILIILITPLHIARYKDGGTVTYTSLTYKIIQWHTTRGKTGVEIHFFPNNFHDLNYFKN